MRVTIRNGDSEVVFETDGKTVQMPMDEVQRSFIFYSLMGCLAILCQVKPMQELLEDHPTDVRQ